jgi:hypothetical protein
LRDAARLIGVNTRRLAGWAERELLVPSVAGEGKGSRRQYTVHDIFMGVLLRLLQETAGDHSTAPQLIASIRETLDEVVDDYIYQVPLDDYEGMEIPPSFTLVLAGDVPALADIAGGNPILTTLLTEAADAGRVSTVIPIGRPLDELLQRLRAGEQ